jgi:tetratricopeptide (TPR) repeat protein
VFWVHGSTKARFEEAYRGIADRLKLPGRYDPNVSILQLVRDWLCDEANGRWTMVLDNIDNVEVFYPPSSGGPSSPLAAYLPQCRNGSILITSRNRDAAAKLTGSYKNVKEVQAMDTGQALQLLQNKLEDGFNEDGAADLLDALNYIPLAITQAAAYISRQAPRTTISSYLDEFRKNDRKKTNLLNRDLGDLRRDACASNSVIATWQISFEHIREERRSAAELLSLMSFFNPQGIPESVLRSHARNTTEADDGGDDKEDIDDQLNDDLDTLRAYSLVTATAESEMWEMHHLVQFCTRVWLSSFTDVEKWRQKFCMLMSSEFPTGNFETWPKCQQLLPHVEPLLSYEPADEGPLREWARLLTNVAWYMCMMGSYRAAEDMVLKAIRVRERTLGLEDFRTLISLSNLASMLQYQGKYEEAEQVNRRALEGREKALGKEHPDTLTSVNDLALVLRYQGKYEEAEQMNRRALEGYEKALGKEHPDTLASVNNLASVLRYHGKYEEAEQMNRRALEGYEKALGKEHPDTITSVYCLAYLYHQRKRYDTASELYQRACDAYKRTLGPQHPTTIACCRHYSGMIREIDQSMG